MARHNAVALKRCGRFQGQPRPGACETNKKDGGGNNEKFKKIL
jgi:hypothetical protein